jgi:hypothetical protein
VNYEQTTGEPTPSLEEQVELLRAGYSAETNERYDALLLNLQWKSLANDNDYQKAAFGALFRELDESIDFHEILLLYVDENPDDALWVSQRKIFSSLQELVMPLPRKVSGSEGRKKPAVDYRYPSGYTQQSKWRRGIDIVKTDPLEAAHFRLNLLTKQLQSNVITRFAPLVVAKQLFGITEPNMLIGGISFGLIESFMANYKTSLDKLPPYNMGHLVGPNRNRYQQSNRLTREFRHMLHHADLRLASVLGFDLDPPKDPLTSSYAYSNSFTAKEFKDRDYRKLVAKYIFEQPEIMHIQTGDFSKPDFVDIVREVAPEWDGLPQKCIEYVFSEYQQSEEGQEQTDANARELAGGDGYIFRMGFMERQPDGRLKFLDHLQNWSANLFVTPPGGEPLHIFRMKDGRAQDIVAGEDLVKAAPKSYKIDPDRLDLAKLEFGMLATA